LSPICTDTTRMSQLLKLSGIAGVLHFKNGRNATEIFTQISHVIPKPSHTDEQLGKLYLRLRTGSTVSEISNKIDCKI